MDAMVREPRRWTRAEFDRLIDQGVLPADERLELLDGEIVPMTPQNSPHTTAVDVSLEALRLALPTGCYVRVQHPLALGSDFQPEPDLAVVWGTPRDYRSAHPSTAALVIEVADSTLKFDRQRKSALYAKASIADYWIVNLIDRIVEIYREPVETSTGWGYRLISRHGETDTVSPLACPASAIPVADLLP